MHQDTSGSTTRRTFVKYGLLSTGALVSSAGGVAAEGSSPTGDDTDRTIERGVMRAYQHVPERRATVRNAVDWRPAGLEDATGSYVISYDATPSYQALLFTTGTDDPALEAGESLSLGGVRGSPDGASRRYVTVGLEALERAGSAGD